MEEIIIHYIGEALYASMGFALGYAIRMLKKKREKDDLEQEALCALVRDRLLHKIEKCLDGGFCSKEMRDNINHMFDIYTRLGGNGTIPPLVKRVMALPMKSPEETK